MTDVPRHHAFLPYPDSSVSSAPHGPLAGLTLAVKDIFDVAGYPTGAGNAYELARSGVKKTTAPIVQTLLDAGAAFVGKTYTDELAYSLLGQNAHFGSSANPAFPGYITGGSSSGSAVAVSGGLADIGLGTDTSGSIRIPAALTGTIGWRPTHGLLPLDLCRPVAPSFDTAGVIVRNLDNLDRLMDVFGIATAATSARMVFMAEALDAADGDAAADCQQTLHASGERFATERVLAGFALPALAEAFQTILRHEAYRSNVALLAARPDAIDPAIRERLENGLGISSIQLEDARKLQSEAAAHMGSQLRSGTVLIFPTLPTLPPISPVDAREGQRFRQRVIALTCLADLLQLTIPLGRERPSQAVSLLAGRDFDRAILTAAKALIGN